jgi:hypothetical protein
MTPNTIQLANTQHPEFHFPLNQDRRSTDKLGTSTLQAHSNGSDHIARRLDRNVSTTLRHWPLEFSVARAVDSLGIWRGRLEG